MIRDLIYKNLNEKLDKQAFIYQNKIFKYSWLFERIEYWKTFIKSQNIKEGNIIAIYADFSPNSIALFITLLDINCIVVPITETVKTKKNNFLEISKTEYLFDLISNNELKLIKLGNKEENKFYLKLRKEKKPGLVLFSSGSSGESKAAVHDFSKILSKFNKLRKSYRTIPFLLFDHIGGINTMLYTLINLGTLIILENRTPESVSKIIEKYKVELLPVSPTFLNLLLISKMYKKYNFKSIKLITYGTELMPEILLKNISKIFPNSELLQTYGLTEVGILSTKSEKRDSLWLKIGGPNYVTKVKNGILYIKAKSTMLGYLNAEEKINDGWFNTEDMVEQKGEYIKFLGRKSEIINVGGQKVYPSEVENILMSFKDVKDALVTSRKNPIMGEVVEAKVILDKNINTRNLSTELKKHCSQFLEKYKVPSKINIIQGNIYSKRFKKLRK